MGSRRILVSPRWVLVSLVFLGFAVRVWKLGQQSLWLDEALSVTFAGESLRDLFPTLIYRDLHPPLYYVLLHFVMRAAGHTEFAVRYLSLVLGLPAVPATYVLGRSLFAGRWRDDLKGRDDSEDRATSVGFDRPAAVGLIGALFVALSPFLVYYAQEARMYSALVTFGVISSLGLWNFLVTGRRRWWVVYVVSTALLAYTQYFGGLVIAFQVLYLVGLLTRRRRRAWQGLLGVMATGILYLPWVPGAYLQIQRLYHVPDFWKGELSLAFVLGHLFAAFTFGQYAVLGSFAVVAVAAAILFLSGLAFLAREALRRGAAEIYLLSYLLVPLAALYAVVVQNPKFTERYLIMIAPPFYLALALAVVEFARWAGHRKGAIIRRGAYLPSIAITVVLLATSVSQLWQVYYGPGYRKEDNRGLAAYVEQHFQPGDVVVLMMDPYSFPWYSDGKIPWSQLQPGNDVTGAANSLNAILAGHKRAWLVLWNADWADPTGYVRQSLDSAYPRETVSQFNGLGLKLYDIDHPPTFDVKTVPDHSEAVNFANRLLLLGYDLPRTTFEAGHAGDVTLYWRALKPLDRDYVVSLRLTDGKFYYWRHDGRPAAITYPTTSWPVGQVVNGKITFQVPAGTPPGSYYLEVGSYAQEVKSDLDVLEDGKVPVGTAARIAAIDVTPPTQPSDPSKLDVPTQPSASFGSELRLLGATVDGESAPPGGAVDVSLYWLAEADHLPSYRVDLQLWHDSYRRSVLQEVPDSGKYPTTRWQKGELVLDKHRIVVPPDAPPGSVKVVARLLAESGQQPVASQPSEVVLGLLTVQNRHVEMTPPPSVGTPVDWTIGNFAHLVGFSLNATSAHPGDHVQLTLYWRALGSSGDVGYTVFSHLLDQRSLIGAQQDHPPANGENPTSGWIAGEYVVDHYDLAIKPDATPGVYQVEIGMYNPSNGARLPVRDHSGAEAGDRVILATVQVK